MPPIHDPSIFNSYGELTKLGHDIYKIATDNRLMAVFRCGRLLNCDNDSANDTVNLVLHAGRKKTGKKGPSPDPVIAKVYEMNQSVACEIPKSILQIQQIVNEKIHLASKSNKHEGIVLKNVSSVLKEYEVDFVVESLQSLGSTLVQFFREIDAEHPTLSDVQNGTLMEGGKVFNRVKEYLEMATFAKSQKSHVLLKVLRDWMHRNHKHITKTMLKPPAKLLLKASARESVRGVFKMVAVVLDPVIDEHKNYAWSHLPNNFLSYTRLGPGVADSVKYYNKMSERCHKLGLSHQASDLKHEVNKLNAVQDDNYYGFIRIDTRDAALILGNTMGIEWNGTRAIIPTSIFTKKFWLNPSESHVKLKLESEYVPELASEKPPKSGMPHTTSAKWLSVIYRPHLYLLANFPVKITASIRKLLDILDHHCDVGDKPLFDLYWVLVPGVFPSTIKDPLEFWDGDQLFQSSDPTVYQKTLDGYLTSEKQIFPIILGENVTKKKMYFISYWHDELPVEQKSTESKNITDLCREKSVVGY